MKKISKTLAMGLLALVVFAGVTLAADAKTTSKSKTLSGKVTSVSTSSFVLKTSSNSYTIDVKSSTKITDSNGTSIKLSSIKKDDSVKATGKVTSKTMKATKVKDTSK